MSDPFATKISLGDDTLCTFIHIEMQDFFLFTNCFFSKCKQLDQLVVENVLAFNEAFWIRLAARTDTCRSDDDKA